MGLRPTAGGSIKVHGEEVTSLSVRERREKGMACVPEDRLVKGLSLQASIEENLVGTSYYQAPYSRNGIMNSRAIADYACECITDYDVRTNNKDNAASTLSGGNMQKVVLARELEGRPDVLIVAQPTRGLDVGSIEFVHSRIVQARDNGSAVLLVSAELGEVMSLSDRIAVVYEGEIVGVIDANEATEAHLGLWMAGVANDQANGREG